MRNSTGSQEPRSPGTSPHKTSISPVPYRRHWAGLFYVAERQLFCVLTGECGTGRPPLSGGSRKELDGSKYTLMYIADSKLTPRNFYKGILDQLGAESKFYRGDAKRQLHKEVELMKGLHKKQPVVVVDEAHLLDREMLEGSPLPAELQDGCREPSGADSGRTDRTLGQAADAVLHGYTAED